MLNIFYFSIKDIIYWIYCEIIASYKMVILSKYDKEYYVCQNVRFVLCLPPKWMTG